MQDVTNCKKAKKLRNKLLLIGLPMTILGYLGVIICIALFATIGYGKLLPIILFLICAVIGSIGYRITALGFKIVITGYTTDLIDDTVGNNCPKCGETITSEMLFCSQCGTKVKKECPNCKHINSHKNEYCEKCGTKLL